MIWWNSVSHDGEQMSYLEGLLRGNPDTLVGSFSGEPEIHDPWHGRIKGDAEVRRFIERTSDWLGKNTLQIETVGVVDTGDYVAEESVIRFTFDGRELVMPVGVTADRDRDGRIDEIRVYYRSDEIDPQRSIRQPLLQWSPDAEVVEGSALDRYLTALTAGDLPAVLAAFEPDGSFQGGADEYAGREGLEKVFTRLFDLGGGVTLEHCKLHDDGVTFVLEFNVLRRGPLRNHPQSGLAVYQRGSSGRIAHARIYDDTRDPEPQDQWA